MLIPISFKIPIFIIRAAFTILKVQIDKENDERKRIVSLRLLLFSTYFIANLLIYPAL